VYGYYFNSANFLAILFEEGCQCLNTINILQIALSLQNYQHKNKCLLLTARFQKGR
jgi:hypothetical protein